MKNIPIWWIYLSSILQFALCWSSSEYHSLGLDLAINGDIKQSLDYFRAAVRLEPENAGYLSDLGVSEMRMGEYEKASKRFSKALEFQPNHQVL